MFRFFFKACRSKVAAGFGGKDMLKPITRVSDRPCIQKLCSCGLMVVSSVFMGSFGAFAGQMSVYTDVDTSVCQLIAEAEEGDGEWATFRCKGVQGLSVFVTEADLRFALGYGPAWQQQKSNAQFLSPFNTIGKKLEWRLKDGRVAATILRCLLAINYRKPIPVVRPCLKTLPFHFCQGRRLGLWV